MQERASRVTKLNQAVQELERERRLVANEFVLDKLTRLASLDARILRYELEKLTLTYPMR